MKPTRLLYFTIVVTTMAHAQSFDDLHTQIESRLSAEKGTYAVAVRDLSSGRELLLNERAVFHAASTMKTPVMIEEYRQARVGVFSLEDSLAVRNEFKSIVDGSPYSMDIEQDSDDSMYSLLGAKATVRALVAQMTTVSSTLPPTLLIDPVAPESVTRRMRKPGASSGFEPAAAQFAGSLSAPTWPEARGLSASDLRWRCYLDTPPWLVSGGVEIGADGLLGRKLVGKGVAIFCQVDPDRLQADQKTYFRYTRWRSTRAVAQLLANLGGTFPMDSRFFHPLEGDASPANYRAAGTPSPDPAAVRECQTPGSRSPATLSSRLHK